MEEHVGDREAARLVNRLRRVEGQARGLQRMIEEGRSCDEIFTQLAATKAALDRAGASVRVISVTLASVALPGEAGRAAARADSIGTLADAAVSAAHDHRSRLSQLARGEAAALLAAARSHRERVAHEAERESARFAMLLAEYRDAPAETRERLRRETLEEVLGSVRCLGAGEAAVAAGDTAGMASEHQP